MWYTWEWDTMLNGTTAAKVIWKFIHLWRQTWCERHYLWSHHAPQWTRLLYIQPYIFNVKNVALINIILMGNKILHAFMLGYPPTWRYWAFLATAAHTMVFRIWLLLTLWLSAFAPGLCQAENAFRQTMVPFSYFNGSWMSSRGGMRRLRYSWIALLNKVSNNTLTASILDYFYASWWGIAFRDVYHYNPHFVKPRQHVCDICTPRELC